MLRKIAALFKGSRLVPIQPRDTAEPVAANATLRVISLLSPDIAAELGGLSQQAICGSFVGDDNAPESFRPNPVFVALMHDIIKNEGPGVAGLCAAAAEQREGWVYVIDLRAPLMPKLLLMLTVPKT